jgi:hypothetical protein
MHSTEGIASINVVANGSQLVDEKTCEKTRETSCKTVEVAMLAALAIVCVSGPTP